MAANDLRLDILGTSFSLVADEEPSYLEAVLSQYRAAVENARDISGLQDPLKIAILTGFLLCDENNKLRKGGGVEQTRTEEPREGEAREVERRTLNLIARIDEALVNSAGSRFSPENPEPVSTGEEKGGGEQSL